MSIENNTTSDNKKRILMLSPGPQYNVKHTFKSRCEEFSQNFSGVVLTSGPESSQYEFGDFKVICIKDPYGKSWISTVGFLLYSVQLLLGGIFKNNPFQLFVTYDPLKTGFIGALATTFFSTKLAVEVNGDYTQDINYEDVKHPLKRKFKKWAMLSVERFVLKRSQGIKLQFKAQVDAFKPFKKKPVIRVFPDYVNADEFEDLGESKEVLFVGFPLKVKGVDFLVPAFKQVSAEFPDWTLKILGYYPDLSELNELIGGNKNIYHHPPIDRSEIGYHMGTCGIFAIASRTEGIPRVLLESMAAGKPRIGSDVGGIPSVINHGLDGFIVKCGDINDLANKLRTLMADKALRERFGEASYQRYRDEFKSDQYFRKQTEFYSSAIDKPEP